MFERTGSIITVGVGVGICACAYPVKYDENGSLKLCHGLVLWPIAEILIRAPPRSAEALAALHKAGFRDAVHVGGGVLAWAKQVDPSLPVY